MTLVAIALGLFRALTMGRIDKYALRRRCGHGIGARRRRYASAQESEQHNGYGAYRGTGEVRMIDKFHAFKPSSPFGIQRRTLFSVDRKQAPEFAFLGPRQQPLSPKPAISWA